LNQKGPTPNNGGGFWPQERSCADGEGSQGNGKNGNSSGCGEKPSNPGGKRKCKVGESEMGRAEEWKKSLL